MRHLSRPLARALLATAALAAALVATNAAPVQAEDGATWQLVAVTEIHMHYLTVDDPPAQVIVHPVPDDDSLAGSGTQDKVGLHNIHINFWAKGADRKRTVCVHAYGVIANCGHHLTGWRWVGHNDQPVTNDTDADGDQINGGKRQPTKEIKPVPHAHVRYELRLCPSAGCGTIPPPTTGYPSPGASGGGTPPGGSSPAVGAVVLYVDSFRSGQSGGTLAADQIVTLRRGAYNGDGSPQAFTADLNLTAPPGYSEGTDPTRNDYQVVRRYNAGTNLWATSGTEALRFFNPTRTSEAYQLHVDAQATAYFTRYRPVQTCSGGGPGKKPGTTIPVTCTTVQQPYQSLESVPVVIEYRPDPAGRFPVLGARLAR